MYKKAWCTCKVVVLLIKPIVFLTFSLPSASLDLKVPNQTYGDTHLSLTEIKMLARGGNFTVKTLFFFSASLKRTPFLSKRVHPFSGLYTLKITFLKRPVKQNKTRLKKDSNCRQLRDGEEEHYLAVWAFWPTDMAKERERKIWLGLRFYSRCYLCDLQSDLSWNKR